MVKVLTETDVLGLDGKKHHVRIHFVIDSCDEIEYMSGSLLMEVNFSDLSQKEKEERVLVVFKRVFNK